jgi:hypothetical protein
MEERVEEFWNPSLPGACLACVRAATVKKWKEEN